MKIVWPIYKKSESALIQLSASIVSVMENTMTCCEIFILCDDSLTDEDRSDLIKLVSPKHKIKFCDIKYDFEKSKFPIEEHSKGSFYRYFIGEFVNEGKVLYLDFDTIVNLDICVFESINLDEKCIAACKDYYARMDSCPRGVNKYFKDREIEVRGYFNAGVLLIDMDKWNSERIIMDAEEYYKRHPKCRFSDQDFLNYYFFDKVFYLPESYNVQGSTRGNCGDTFEEKECIFHFCGKIKPLNICRNNADILFWKYVSKTKYGYYGEDLLNILPLVCSNIPDLIDRGIIIGEKSNLVRSIKKRVVNKVKFKYSNNPFDSRQV